MRRHGSPQTRIARRFVDADGWLMFELECGHVVNSFARADLSNIRGIAAQRRLERSRSRVCQACNETSR